ncbi:MGH1-like glycoside hydrolase domain-containing protein [Terrarubrum flagellatum]|uniref:MGH1-like glycoside hydrolase domain-containing protein n=1 Tax=Terrirubrum flagellatum TaxID=2895980 RepID=UPI003144FA2D
MPVLQTKFIDDARAVLAANDRGGYTVPTHGLYPFQWNWDSAFVAMGFATFDIDRGLTELERLVEGQWDDGMIPHIVFHAPSDTYFPGPEVWGTRHRIPTSGITQPPVLAIALADIARRAGSAHRERIVKLYRAAMLNHRWWRSARDPENTGLVAILHNWETGRDNSPEWDRPFERVPETTVTAIRRRDTGHVDASMRPRDIDYRRYIHLVDSYRAAEWNPARMWRIAPFKVADIGVNAILLAAEEALLGMAADFGDRGDAAKIEARIDLIRDGLQKAWNGARRQFQSRDLIDGERLDILTSAGFLPLLTDAPSSAQVKEMVAALRAIAASGAMLVPSTAPGEAGFESKRYWRGPVWAVVNWLIARGLERHGEGTLADAIRRETADGIERAGLCEYFDPISREGLGGLGFSWTAAIYLLIAEQGRVKRAA